VGVWEREREGSALYAPQRPEREKKYTFSSNLSNCGNVDRPVCSYIYYSCDQKLFFSLSLVPLVCFEKKKYFKRKIEVFCDFLIRLCSWLFFPSWLSIIEFLIETVLSPINYFWRRIEVRRRYHIINFVSISFQTRKSRNIINEVSRHEVKVWTLAKNVFCRILAMYCRLCLL